MPEGLLVTTVRFRRLKSAPTGYHHNALEAEAEVPAGEAPDDVLDRLIAWIDERLGLEERIADGRKRIERLAYEVMRLERQKADLELEIRRDREVIEKYDDLRELAQERGIKAGEELGDTLPF